MRRMFAAAAAMIMAAAPAHAKWHEASTDHFLIYSEEKPDSLRAFAEKLEKYDAAMRMLRGIDNTIPGPANRLTIYVVSDIAAVQRILGKGSQNIAGFYIPRAEGSVAYTPRRAGDGNKNAVDPEKILLHEYAHHFMMQNFPGVFPAWFIEGYAEFSATTKFEKDGSVGVGTPALHRAAGLFRGKTLSVEQLVTASVPQLKPDEREEVYGRGWLLTHYLTFERSRAGQLKAYLRALNSGTSNLEAAKAAFGDLKVLDQELRKYVTRPRLSYVKLEAGSFKIGNIAIRALRPAEEAVMDVRIRSDRGVNREAAKALVPLARKAAAPFPSDPAAQATLAEAEYDAGNHAEAEAAADRALAADPKSIDALIYKGRAKLALAQAARATDAATWREVRKWFVAANKLDPDDPEPLILFYRSHLVPGQRPNANAALGLVRALELAPQDRTLRWNVARQLLRDGKVAEARAALAPLAFDPHGGKRAEFASAILAKIDSTGTKAALEAAESDPDAEADESS